ncbi:MAG: hypothetical protein IPM99_11095 [Rubrivivax sp.]|nr:hypothetical protein [Rubrivivax sp.]
MPTVTTVTALREARRPVRPPPHAAAGWRRVPRAIRGRPPRRRRLAVAAEHLDIERGRTGNRWRERKGEQGAESHLSTERPFRRD